MNINRIGQEDGTLTIALEGRLDTMTAPELEAFLATALEGVGRLVMDFSALEYISSAGLRVILGARQTLAEEDSVTIRHANDYIMETFEMTGFLDFLNIEE